MAILSSAADSSMGGLAGRACPPEDARVELVGDRASWSRRRAVEHAGHEVRRQVVADLAPLDSPRTNASCRTGPRRRGPGRLALIAGPSRGRRSACAEDGPVVADEVAGTVEPVAHDGEEAGLDDIGRRVLPAGERPDSRAVRREEQPRLRFEVREHGSLGDADSVAIASTRAPS